MTPLRLIAGLVLIAATMLAGTAYGDGQAGQETHWRHNGHDGKLPFPRSKRADSVWASGRCWRECGSFCAWGMAGCLREDAQGRCLKLTDKCDRYCQRECRTTGGPFLSFELPWE
jgi:hypothetical protein